MMVVKKIFWNSFLVLLTLCCTSILSADEYINEINECGPVLDNAVLFVAEECLNDSTALVVDSSKADATGWQYSRDSHGDSTPSTGSSYEIYGMALRETVSDVIIAIRANMPIDGNRESNASDGTIGWGDLFINFTGEKFLPTSDASKFFAVRFTEKNSSGASQLGVYNSSNAKSVTSINYGHKDWETYVKRLGSRTAHLGDFGENQSYYNSKISQNVIKTANYSGAIETLTEAQLIALDFDPDTVLFAKNSKTKTLGFRFKKNLIVGPCGYPAGDPRAGSCLDACGVYCGEGPGECGCNGIVKDECGVCGGLNEDKGCDGVCFSDKTFGCDGICGSEEVEDDCGVCGGSNEAKGCDGVCGSEKVEDDCGVCDGSNKTKGCDGICDSQKIIDECGICGGDDSCRDCAGELFGPRVEDPDGVCCEDKDKGCDGICFSEKAVDDCGVCGGEDKDKGCDGICFSEKAVDDCGVCGGEDKDKGCDGICFSEKITDDCGVCGGNDKDKGCDGICFSEKVADECGVCGGSDKDKGCDDVCFSNAVVDECDVCDGDGSTCQPDLLCIEVKADTTEVRKARRVKKTAKVLKDRTERFVGESKRCTGKDYSKLYKKAKRQFTKVKSVLNTTVTNTVTECANSICTQEKTGKTRRNLKTLVNKLYQQAKVAKLNALRECNVQDNGSPDTRKNTEDYRADVMTAINALPKTKMSCE